MIIVMLRPDPRTAPVVRPFLDRRRYAPGATAVNGPWQHPQAIPTLRLSPRLAVLNHTAFVSSRPNERIRALQSLAGDGASLFGNISHNAATDQWRECKAVG